MEQHYRCVSCTNTLAHIRTIKKAQPLRSETNLRVQAVPRHGSARKCKQAKEACAIGKDREAQVAQSIVLLLHTQLVAATHVPRHRTSPQLLAVCHSDVKDPKTARQTHTQRPARQPQCQRERAEVVGGQPAAADSQPHAVRPHAHSHETSHHALRDAALPIREKRPAAPPAARSQRWGMRRQLWPGPQLTTLQESHTTMATLGRSGCRPLGTAT
jgi:hypothetical protein